MSRKIRVATSRCDLAGMPVGRVLRRELLFKGMPFGYFGGGANLLYLPRLVALHGGGCWPHLAARWFVERGRALRVRRAKEKTC
jgi:hypothetical protein